MVRVILDSGFLILDWEKGFESSSSAWARRFGPPKSMTEVLVILDS